MKYFIRRPTVGFYSTQPTSLVELYFDSLIVQRRQRLVIEALRQFHLIDLAAFFDDGELAVGPKYRTPTFLNRL